VQEETTIPGFCHSLCEKVPVSDLCSAFVPLVEAVTDVLEEKPSADTAKYCDKRFVFISFHFVYISYS
jgi:hypothetical protein